MMLQQIAAYTRRKVVNAMQRIDNEVRASGRWPASEKGTADDFSKAGGMLPRDEDTAECEA